MKILVEDGDHGYREATIVEKQVVWSEEQDCYFEFYDEADLEEGEVVVTRMVAE